MSTSNLPICTACGTQFETDGKSNLSNCNICDDPRQFVPAAGQTWTTLSDLQKMCKNEWRQDEVDGRLWSIWTEPKFAIGQRAILLETPEGNVLWDLITLLDKATIDFIKSKGGLKAIVISHPHYYTTYVEWATTFNCPVYLSYEDREWISRYPPHSNPAVHIREVSQAIVPGVTAVKVGGHFPGSLVLHWERKLFVADSLVTVPSAYTPREGSEANETRLSQSTFAFMWSIPNMIPLAPDVIQGMWEALEPFEFDESYGAFVGTNVKDKALKKRTLQSMKMQISTGGWTEHALLKEEVCVS